MIPRFAPTYMYPDLLKGVSRSLPANVDGELRSRLAAMHNVAHVFLVDSARVALYVLLKAYNRPGGVLLPAYNCIVVPEAVRFAGYEPVFVDIDRASLNMTPGALAKRISEGISVVLATHLFGIPCDVEEIRRAVRGYDVLVIEDAAPALGAELRGRLVGDAADAAIISFQSTKVISGEGGGALLTNNDDLAAKVRRILQTAFTPQGLLPVFLKSFGRKAASCPPVYAAAQRCYRILRDEQMYELVQPHTEAPSRYLRLCSKYSAYLVLRQLENMSWNLARRRKIAQIYQEELHGLPLRLPVFPDGASPAWIQYPIQVDDKESVYRHMQKKGVDLTWTYRYSCAESYGLNGFVNAHEAAKTVLGLPTYPSLTDDQARFIGSTVKAHFDGK